MPKVAKRIHFFTKRLGKYREENSISQKELAELLTTKLGRPVSYGMVRHWEAQTKAVTGEVALEVASALKLEPVELFERKSND